MSTNLAHLPSYVPRWTFAERIRKVRRDQGLTQEEFAENVLHIRLSTYSAWETGRNTPDLAQLAPILERSTGVPRAWFLGWMDEAPSAASEPDPTAPVNRATGANLRPSDYKSGVASLDDFRARKAS